MQFGKVEGCDEWETFHGCTAADEDSGDGRDDDDGDVVMVFTTSRHVRAIPSQFFIS